MPEETHTSRAARLTAELPSDLEILRRLAVGGSAEVFLARELSLGRTVAVKVLENPADPRAVLRFEREAKAVAALTHPSIVAVYRLGRLTDQTPFIVMQYVRGRSAADRLAADGPWDPGSVRQLIQEIADALTAAHAHGIVHRDVRPGNILCDEESGRFLLADFGIAALYEGAGAGEPRLTHAGELLGDIHYISPEQLRGETASAQSDIYALGITAAELITGEVPGAGGNRLEFVTRRMSATPPQLDGAIYEADRGLAELLTRCLSPDPAKRPTAATLARVATLERPAASLNPSRIATIWRSLVRRRIPQWVGSVIAGGGVMLEVVSQMQGNGMLPPVAYTVTLVTVVALVACTVVAAWYHGERGRQRSSLVEITLQSAIVLAWALGVAAVLLA